MSLLLFPQPNQQPQAKKSGEQISRSAHCSCKVVERKKQFLSHVLLCNHIVAHREPIAVTCRLYKYMCLWLLLSPSPLLLSCNLSPPTDHPWTPTTSSGGEFGRNCHVSTYDSLIKKAHYLRFRQPPVFRLCNCSIYSDILNLNGHAVSFTGFLAWNSDFPGLVIHQMWCELTPS